jgi:hypothetical protein
MNEDNILSKTYERALRDVPDSELDNIRARRQSASEMKPANIYLWYPSFLMESTPETQDARRPKIQRKPAVPCR